MTHNPTPYVIFINGPPRSGKDTLALTLLYRLRGLQVVKFARHIKRAAHFAHGLYNLVDEPEHFDAVKDQPRGEFFGATPRRAYIEFSENYMKPLHGKDVFGKILAREMDQLVRRVLGLTGFAISDSGFADEAAPVIRRFGAENCLLLRIHAEERGCSFEGDSRSYIDLPGVRTHDIENNGAQHAFVAAGEALVKRWLFETQRPAGDTADELPGSGWIA